MPRKQGLSIVSERAATDEEMALSAAIAMDRAGREEVAPPDDIVAELRRQLGETARVASLAITERDAAVVRASTAEDGRAREREAATADKIAIQEAATAQVVDIRTKAATAVAEAQRQSQVAVKTAEAAYTLRQAAGTVGAMLAFVADRAPACLALLGAYLLASNVLPHPEPLQLVALATFGVVGVLPAVWLSMRRG